MVTSSFFTKFSSSLGSKKKKRKKKRKKETHTARGKQQSVNHDDRLKRSGNRGSRSLGSNYRKEIQRDSVPLVSTLRKHGGAVNFLAETRTRRTEELSDRFFSTGRSLRTRTQRDKRGWNRKRFLFGVGGKPLCLSLSLSLSLSPTSPRSTCTRSFHPFLFFFLLFFFLFFLRQKFRMPASKVTGRRRAGYFCRFSGEKNCE